MQTDQVPISALPSISNASALYLSNQRRVLKSLLHVAKASAKPLNLDISGIERLLDRFNDEPVSAYLFAINTLCVEAVKQRRGLDQLRHSLEDINGKTDDELLFVTPTISNISDIEWMQKFMDEVPQIANKVFDAHRDVYKLIARVGGVPAEYYPYHENLVKRALILIKNSPSGTYFDELCRYVSIIGLYDGEGISGWSSEQHIGAIFIRNSKGNGDLSDAATVVNSPPLVYYVEQLIHETAHVHLDLVMNMEKLFHNGTEAKYISPIRYDPRPMRGVLHAVFVLARIQSVLRTIKFPERVDNDYRDARCEAIVKQVKTGIEEIYKHAELTSAGVQLIGEVAALVPN